MVEYTTTGDSFVPGKPRLWSEYQIFDPGVSHMDLAPDGKRFAILAPSENAGPEKGSVHVDLYPEILRRTEAQNTLRSIR